MALTTTMVRIKQRLDMLRLSSKLSSATVAAVFGIHQMRLSNAVSGKVYLGGKQEAALSNFTLRILELEDAARPFALPADEDQLRALLHADLEVESVRGTIQSLFVKQ
jgi:hypothetical protein